MKYLWGLLANAYFGILLLICLIIAVLRMFPERRVWVSEDSGYEISNPIPKSFEGKMVPMRAIHDY